MSYRSQYQGLFFVPETTFGTDPGIVADVNAGNFVDASTETDDWVPEDGAVAFARMAEPASGLPKYNMLDVPQTFQISDYDNSKTYGLKSDGEITLSFAMQGAATEATSGYAVPPPWLQLAGSALGIVLGYSTGSHDFGGDNSTPVAVSAATGAGAWTNDGGKVGPGYCVFVDDADDGDWAGLALARVKTSSGATDVSTCNIDLPATPSASDPVYFPVQASFDKRFEASDQSFTLLLQRETSAATMVIRGAQAKSWEIESNFGQVPMIKLTMIYQSWTAYEDGAVDTDVWTAEPTPIEEPSYYETTWSCPKVSQGGNFVYQDPSDSSIVRNLDIAGVKISWNSGLERRGASTAKEGVAALLAKNKSELRFTFTTLYSDDWRQFLASHCNSSVNDTFPVYYWEGSSLTNVWYFAAPAMFLLDDPGFEGDEEGLMAQEIVLGLGKYDGDGGTTTFDGGDFVDTRFAIGAL